MLGFIKLASSALGVAAAFALIPTENGPATIALAFCVIACLAVLYWACEREDEEEVAVLHADSNELFAVLDALDAHDARNRAEVRL